MISYFYNIYFGESNTNFTKTAFEKLPLPTLGAEEEKLMIDFCYVIIDLIKGFNEIKHKFQKFICEKFQFTKLSNKLKNWHELEFGDFINELNKGIKNLNKERVKGSLKEIEPLTKKDEFEWLDLFEENKKKAQGLQSQINQTDKEIDAMVYELYGLTDDEIKIVENS
ncbi:hypothetical protein [Psychroserpens ponticola]|uniref:Site-specific DNA-methyltransferase (adenine-specific) n=1 Tax=Psychroserpens ponticola TaxID=2932268 RepID=A0ABY7RUR6_9FLAO|nr:hypothetical protein [Psychroserpens ponticola]WCO00862.1 hypothetical protein MUN68_012390 [Psychroserpens ponticola]